jgi:hypothetical protein
LVNNDAKVIGVIQGGLREGGALLDDGGSPQLVNYAIKSSLLLELLNGIPDVDKHPPRQTKNGSALTPTEQTEVASVLIWVYGD